MRGEGASSPELSLMQQNRERPMQIERRKLARERVHAFMRDTTLNHYMCRQSPRDPVRPAIVEVVVEELEDHV